MARRVGFQLPGQLPFEVSRRKLRAPRGKFILVEKSANNITGWGYTILGTFSTKKRAQTEKHNHRRRISRESLKLCANGRVTEGFAYNSLDVLILGSDGYEA